MLLDHPPEVDWMRLRSVQASRADPQGQDQEARRRQRRCCRVEHRAFEAMAEVCRAVKAADPVLRNQLLDAWGWA